MIMTPLMTPKGVHPFYGIDEYGNLYRIKGDKAIRLANHVNDNGYVIHSIPFEGKMYYFRAHRLVMINYYGYEYPELDINHIDGNKQNNHISNLEWLTRSDNIKHAYANHLHEPAPSYGNKNGNSRYSQELIEKVIIDLFINHNTCQHASDTYKVGLNTCKAIKSKRMWKWLIDNILNKTFNDYPNDAV